MKKITFISLLVFVLLLTASCGRDEPPAFDPITPDLREEKVIIPTVEIITEGYGKNESSAIIDARLKAIQQVVGLNLLITTETTNYTLLDQSILSRTQNYIKNEIILSSYIYQGPYYKVRIKFTVVKDIPSEDYYYIIRRMNKPRIGVWLPSKAYRGLLEFEDRSAEIAIQEVLLKHGFDVYDTARLSELIKIRTDGEPDYQSLRQYGVDVLITGEIYGESIGRVAGMQGARSIVNLKVYWTQTGRLISSVSETEGDHDISALIAAKKAVNRASAKAAESISKQTIKTWMENIANGLPLQISFHNISLDEMISFRNYLRNTPGVIETMSPTIEGNYAEMIVYTYLDSFDFYANIIREFFGDKAVLENNYLTLITLRLK